MSVSHLLAGLFPTDCAGVGRLQPDLLHLQRPLLVVITARRGLAMLVLPDVRHFVRERRRDLLVATTDEVVGVERQLVPAGFVRSSREAVW